MVFWITIIFHHVGFLLWGIGVLHAVLTINHAREERRGRHLASIGGVHGGREGPGDHRGPRVDGLEGVVSGLEGPGVGGGVGDQFAQTWEAPGPGVADHGLAEACQRQPALIGGINVMNGHVTHKAVAEAHGLKFSAPQL